MKFLRKFGIGGLLLAAAAGICAANTTYHFSGHSCQERDTSDSSIYYDSYGVRNNTTTADDTHALWCPVEGWQNSTVNLDSATVNYVDGSSYYSVQCQLFETNTSQVVYSSSTKYSCSTDTVNGCTTDSDVSYKNAGSITWLSTALPASGADIFNVGAFGYFCQLPSQKHLTITESYSRLISYAVEQVNP